MPITEDEVIKIAALAHLELTDEEVREFTGQLSSIVSYIDQLNELDTAEVEPMSHSGSGQHDPRGAWRDDEVVDGVGQRAALSNTPEGSNGYFKVPKVI